MQLTGLSRCWPRRFPSLAEFPAPLVKSEYNMRCHPIGDEKPVIGSKKPPILFPFIPVEHHALNDLAATKNARRFHAAVIVDFGKSHLVTIGITQKETVIPHS